MLGVSLIFLAQMIYSQSQCVGSTTNISAPGSWPQPLPAKQLPVMRTALAHRNLRVNHVSFQPAARNAEEERAKRLSHRFE